MNVCVGGCDRRAGPAAHSLRAQDCALVPIGYALSLPDTSYRAIAMKRRTPLPPGARRSTSWTPPERR